MVVSVSSLKWSVVVIENEGTRYEHIYCAGLCATKRIAEELRADTDADYFCCNGLSCADTWNPETGFDWLRILVVPTVLLKDFGISLEDIVPEFEFGVATKQGNLIATTVGYEEESILASRDEDWMPVVLGNTIRLVATQRLAIQLGHPNRPSERRTERKERSMAHSASRVRRAGKRLLLAKQSQKTALAHYRKCQRRVARLQRTTQQGDEPTNRDASSQSE